MKIHERFATELARVELSEGATPELLPVRLAKVFVQVLPPVAGAGISLFADPIRIPVGASDEHAAHAERLQFTLAEGPCVTAHDRGERVLADEETIKQQWPLFHRSLTSQTPFRAIAALPLPRRSARWASVDLFFRDTTGLTQLDLQAAAQAVALVGTHLVVPAPPEGPAWLEGPAMNPRSWTMIAMGMLNVALDLPVDDTLDLLRAHAFATNRTVDEVSEDVVNRRLAAHQLRPQSDA